MLPGGNPDTSCQLAHFLLWVLQALPELPSQIEQLGSLCVVPMQLHMNGHGGPRGLARWSKQMIVQSLQDKSKGEHVCP